MLTADWHSAVMSSSTRRRALRKTRVVPVQKLDLSTNSDNTDEETREKSQRQCLFRGITPLFWFCHCCDVSITSGKPIGMDVFIESTARPPLTKNEKTTVRTSVNGWYFFEHLPWYCVGCDSTKGSIAPKPDRVLNQRGQSNTAIYLCCTPHEKN